MAWAVKLRLMTIVPFATQNSENIALPMGWHCICLGWQEHCWAFPDLAVILLGRFDILLFFLVEMPQWYVLNSNLCPILPHPLRNWFKGADTVCLLAFLEAWIGPELHNLEGDSRTYFANIFKMISTANSFMRCMYHAALFLTCEERNHLLKMGVSCIDAFHKCAQKAFEMEVTRWKYMPKLHMFGEILFKLHIEKREDLPSVNPLAYGTQQDEDFVGRISAISRNVSVRTVHVRTLTRYLVSLASHW
jgi:hypothetical protein